MSRSVPRNLIIRQIVGRCHISDSNMSVIRYVISRLRDGHATFRAMAPSLRRQLLREIIQAHRGNQRLYVEVMSGFRRTINTNSKGGVR